VRAFSKKQRPTFGDGGQAGAPKPRVLLLDEVDVFFSDSFYGRLYRTCHSVCHDACAEIIYHVWTERGSLTGDIDMAVEALLKMPQVTGILETFQGEAT